MVFLHEILHCTNFDALFPSVVIDFSFLRLNHFLRSLNLSITLKVLINKPKNKYIFVIFVISGRLGLFYGNKTSSQFAAWRTTLHLPGELTDNILLIPHRNKCV